jgi:hypothetical protein
MKDERYFVHFTELTEEYKLIVVDVTNTPDSDQLFNWQFNHPLLVREAPELKWRTVTRSWLRTFCKELTHEEYLKWLRRLK